MIRLRREAADQVERLLAFLDVTDGADADDEPSIGLPLDHRDVALVDTEEDRSDDEPEPAELADDTEEGDELDHGEACWS